MFPHLRHAARIGCALSLLACAGEKSPTAPPADPIGTVVPSLSSYSTAPTAEDFAEMPAEFQTAPSIISARTIVGFIDPEGVYAQGIMTYFATDAEQDVTLVLRDADSEVMRMTRRGSQEAFFPAMRSLRTNVSFGVNGSCGHRADGFSAHRAWHKFIVGGWKFLSWGNHQKASGGQAAQPACPPPSSGGGGNGDYDTGCQACQQWFLYEDGQRVDEWWECTEVDVERCDSRER
jgi:hypothetical protein